MFGGWGGPPGKDLRGEEVGRRRRLAAEEKQGRREIKAPFGRASRAAPGEALPNVCFVTDFTREAGSEAVGGLHREGEAMKSWFHAAYTSI